MQALQVKLPTYVELTVKDTAAVSISSTDTSYKPVQTEEVRSSPVLSCCSTHLAFVCSVGRPTIPASFHEIYHRGKNNPQRVGRVM